MRADRLLSIMLLLQLQQRMSAAQLATRLGASERTILSSMRYKGWRLEAQVDEGKRIHVRLRFDSEAEVVQLALAHGADIELIELVGREMPSATLPEAQFGIAWRSHMMPYVDEQSPWPLAGHHVAKWLRSSIFVSENTARRLM